MKTSDMIADIQVLIMETYEDKEPLEKNQEVSKNCFFYYCRAIKKDLDTLEKIRNSKTLLKLIDRDINLCKSSIKKWVRLKSTNIEHLAYIKSFIKENEQTLEELEELRKELE